MTPAGPRIPPYEGDPKYAPVLFYSVSEKRRVRWRIRRLARRIGFKAVSSPLVKVGVVMTMRHDNPMPITIPRSAYKRA